MPIGADRTALARRVLRPLAVAACAIALAGCSAAAPRIPYTQRNRRSPSFPAFRVPACGRMIRPSAAARRAPSWPASALTQPTVLALSGGGADGAFGAGLLTGWSARGTRPQFTFVTGASAGALIAPFAFLGRDL